MTRSTPARAAAWNTFARASRLGPISSSHGANSLPLAARWTTVSTPWKCVIHSSSRIARSATMTSGSSAGSGFVDQDQVVRVGPGRAELAADVAACSRDQDRPRLLFDQPGKQLVREFGSSSSSSIIVIVVVIIVVEIVVLIVDLVVVDLVVVSLGRRESSGS